MESFRDAIVAAEAPHAGNFLLPIFQGLSETGHRSKGRFLELPDAIEEFANARSAGDWSEAMRAQQVPELLFELIEGGNGRMGLQINVQLLSLFGI